MWCEMLTVDEMGKVDEAIRSCPADTVVRTEFSEVFQTTLARGLLSAEGTGRNAVAIKQNPSVPQ